MYIFERNRAPRICYSITTYNVFMYQQKHIDISIVGPSGLGRSLGGLKRLSIQYGQQHISRVSQRWGRYYGGWNRVSHERNDKLVSWIIRALFKERRPSSSAYTTQLSTFKIRMYFPIIPSCTLRCGHESLRCRLCTARFDFRE